MYLSCLLIDVGDNPDRPRPGRLWLRNLYHVHQRLCMAFPSASRTSGDEHFLKPYAPGDFGQNQVHVKRSADAGFLFRIDPLPAGRVMILVQSAAQPNWDYAFHNAGYLLACRPEVKCFDPSFTNGQRLRFRLVANPTKRLTANSRERDGRPVADKWVGKRIPVRTEELDQWLITRAEKAGFRVVDGSLTTKPGYIYVNKTPNGSGHRLRSARYDGILAVTHSESFRETLARGIGPAKAFGFGLLSVAPV